MVKVQSPVLIDEWIGVEQAADGLEEQQQAEQVKRKDDSGGNDRSAGMVEPMVQE